MVASQDDQFQIGQDMGGKEPTGTKALAYASRFANLTLSHALAVQNSQRGIFSWACYNHAVSETDSGFNRKTAGDGVVGRQPATMNDALVAFLGWDDAGAGKPLAWVDSCQGWKCGKGCGANNY